MILSLAALAAALIPSEPNALLAAALPGDAPVELISQGPLETVPGIEGEAWRTDGFSAYGRSEVRFDGDAPLSLSLWTALESYPSDREGPIAQATPSAFVTQRSEDAGFDVFIDTYGVWGLRVATTDGDLTLQADDPFPLYEWTHIAATIDPGGIVRLYRDGQVVAEERMARRAVWRPADTDLMMARGWRDAEILNFRINGLNGAFDLLKIERSAWSSEAVATQASAYSVPDVSASLAVPQARFAGDHLRPRYHAMPPANWTNEPHGLVRWNDRWHLFYQRTPNGPYKTQMHWGHMSSPDLVSWTHQRDALWPTLQTEEFGFDMKGIWSGDVIVQGGAAYAYYTSVNHGPTYNPAVSVAVSTDPDLQVWEKRGPLFDTTYVEDFRDPYLWQEDGQWHMIVGSAFKSGGGLDYYVCRDGGERHCWDHERRFTSVPYRRMDPGSLIWEMPVFEPMGEKHILLVNPIGGDVSKYGEPATRAVYWTGTWDDGRFDPDDTTPRDQDLLPGQLAPTVAPIGDGKLLGIGIVDERRSPQAQEDAGWAHTFSLPRIMELRAGGTLVQSPAPSLTALRQEDAAIELEDADAKTARRLADVGPQAELVATFPEGLTEPFGVVIGETPDGQERTTLIYDPATSRITLDLSSSTLATDELEGPERLSAVYDRDAFGPPLRWHVYVDGSVADVFIGEGAATAFRFYPTREDATGLGVVVEDGATIPSAVVWPLTAAAIDYAFED